MGPRDLEKQMDTLLAPSGSALVCDLADQIQLLTYAEVDMECY